MRKVSIERDSNHRPHRQDEQWHGTDCRDDKPTPKVELSGILVRRSCRHEIRLQGHSANRAIRRMIARHSWTHWTEIAGTRRRRFFGDRKWIQKLGTTMLAAEIPFLPIPFARDGRLRVNRHPADRVHFQACGRSILNDSENGKIERRSSVIHDDQTFRNDKVHHAAQATAVRSVVGKNSKATLDLNKFLSHI